MSSSEHTDTRAARRASAVTPSPGDECAGERAVERSRGNRTMATAPSSTRDRGAGGERHTERVICASLGTRRSHPLPRPSSPLPPAGVRRPDERRRQSAGDLRAHRNEAMVAAERRHRSRRARATTMVARNTEEARRHEHRGLGARARQFGRRWSGKLRELRGVRSLGESRRVKDRRRLWRMRSPGEGHERRRRLVLERGQRAAGNQRASRISGEPGAMSSPSTAPTVGHGTRCRRAAAWHRPRPRARRSGRSSARPLRTPHDEPRPPRPRPASGDRRARPSGCGTRDARAARRRPSRSITHMDPTVNEGAMVRTTRRRPFVGRCR